MASKVSSPSGAKETVLLRKPAPKYGFAGRKLPKDPVNSSAETPLVVAHPISTPSEVRHVPSSSTNTGLTSDLGSQQKPVAVVEASFHSHASTVADFRAKFPGFASESRDAESLSSTSSVPNLVDFGASDSRTATVNVKYLQLTSQNISSNAESQSPQDKNFSGSSIADINQAQDAFTEEDPSSSSASQSEQLQNLREERDKLRTELNAQLQVNAELKRLLVASVGDDLYERVQNLCRDRAQLELDIGGFSKKMSEDYENLDKVSIQADMWRSKYLASRVMTEELSSAKAYYALQCHESHTALHQLLNERQELRTNLVESYKVLQQVKNAFDPLNTHRSSSLRSTSVLSLSQACQQLSEAVRYRLLPANVAINVSADVSTEAWQDSVTRAEQFAQEVLSRPVEAAGPNSCKDSQNPQPGSSSHHTRYHPATRYENLTMTCCTRCRGEILVV